MIKHKNDQQREIIMIDVKCYTFNVDFIVNSDFFSSYTLEEQYLDITLKDGRVVTPYLMLTPVGESIPKFDAEDMVEGYINNGFNVVSCNVREDNDKLSFSLTFTLEFSLSSQVDLKDSTLVYSQDDGDYKYKIEGAFTDMNAPSLTRSIDVDSSISMDVQESIQNMTM